MRKVLLGVAVSLDGFIEGPKGEYDWCFTDQDYGLSDFMKGIDGIFMGRKSYEVAQQYEGQNPWKGMKTYVFSNTIKSTSKEVEIVSGDISKKVAEIKNSKGKDLWLFGGADLTTQFINQNSIDELWLSIHPILLGSGKPLFQNLDDRKNLELIDHKIYDTGLVSVLYKMKR
jgi:dihydrofolate reductase